MARATKKICSGGCGAIVDSGYCAECYKVRENARGSRQSRGYDHRHEAIRKRTALLVAAGKAVCNRCGGAIAPGTAWHLDHDDERTGYRGAAHASCNSAAGGRNSGRYGGGR